jgi:hypothetical protein
LRIELDECVRVEPGRQGESSSRALDLLGALREASASGILAVHLGSTVRVVSERSERRLERWAPDAQVRDLRVEALDIHPVAADVRVAGYLGGWG